MRILIADKFEDEGLQQLKPLAEALEIDPALKEDALKQKVAAFKPNVLIVRSTKVPADIQSAADSLQLIIRAGSGFDTIDIAAAAERNIRVCNCPGMNAVAVAELAMGLVMSLDRRIPDNCADLRAGAWNKKGYSKARGLKGRTIGVIGAGKIGTEVAKRALAFDMKVLYTHLGRNPWLAENPNCERTTIPDLLRRADFISIHVPGGAGTKALIGEKELASMKPTACLINTSRSSVIDEAALITALKAGTIAGAAVDVYDNEPAADAKEITSPLRDAPNLYGTHHIGASTEQAQLAVADEVVNIVKHFKDTGGFLHCVNTGGGAGACILAVRLTNKPGALAYVFSKLQDAEADVVEVDHATATKEDEGFAHIRLSKPPAEAIVKALCADSSYVLGADVVPA